MVRRLPGKRGTLWLPTLVTALPFYHSREDLSSPNFQLCAFPLEKVSASLRAARAISQRQGAYKITLVVLQALQKSNFV